jgi:hypothetical protein
MQHSSSWEANRFPASQQIPHIIWNSKVHYRTHNCPPPAPILSQINPVHTPTSHFLKNQYNIILSSTSTSSNWSLSLRPPDKNAVNSSPLSDTCYMSWLCQASRFDHPNNMWWAVQIIKQYRSLSSTDHQAVQIIKQYRSLSSTDH